MIVEELAHAPLRDGLGYLTHKSASCKRGSVNVLRSESDRSAALPRNDAMCQDRTFGPGTTGRFRRYRLRGIARRRVRLPASTARSRARPMKAERRTAL